MEQVKAQPVRWCAIDGRLPDLESNPSPYLVPLVSDSWRPTFPVQIDAPLSSPDREKLQSLVQRAHEQGRRIRFWGARDNPVVWREQFDAGVDLINTDKLEGLREFLLRQGR
jgi:glycerophosphoryl diester phosphodiesterase